MRYRTQSLAPFLFESRRRANDSDPTTVWKRIEDLTSSDTVLYESMYHDFLDPNPHWDHYLRHWRARIKASPLNLSAFHGICSTHPDRIFAKALAAVVAFGADAGYFGP